MSAAGLLIGGDGRGSPRAPNRMAPVRIRSRSISTAPGKERSDVFARRNLSAPPVKVNEFERCDCAFAAASLDGLGQRRA